ncbi:hypothetical protein OHA25_61075 (plasmid) [Nonomuraea sp. NBC_00507]|uniref:hypothetical protein n=1 Tax=Nonomuraea sp. NBC_00507 TaxID=2976002 RepID=UPI002E172706
MDYAEGVELLRDALARAGPRAAEALRRHEQDEVRRRERRARLQDPNRWARADAAAVASIENAALERATGVRERWAEQQQASDEQERRRAESLARARARARRERGEHSA